MNPNSNKREIWKDIKGYKGKYTISNYGNVKSISRVVVRKNGRKHTVKGIKKSTHLNPKGYKIVSLSNQGKHTTHTIHQLVAQTFLNHKKCGMHLVINHIDNNKLNNFLGNLEIISNRKNSTIHRKKGTSKYPGVHYCKRVKRWIARIQVKGSNIYLGSFIDEIEAAKAYDNYVIENRLEQPTNFTHN